MKRAFTIRVPIHWSLAAVGSICMLGCAAPSGLFNVNQSNDDDFEHVITVDDQGNVKRGDEGEPPVIAPRAASVLGHQTRRESNAGESAQAKKPELTPQPVTPIPVGTSLREQSDNFHDELARITGQSKSQAATQPALPSTDSVAVTALPTSEFEMPRGIEPTIVRSPKFKLDYNDKLLGAGGIARVELYGTRDNGRTWRKMGEDKDRRSPLDVDVEGEGLYGFRIAVAGHNGLASRPPRNGELPELWVKVDGDTPVFHGDLRAHEGDFHIADVEAPIKSEMEETVTSSPKDSPTPRHHSGHVSRASHEVPVADYSSSSDAELSEETDWRTNLDRAISNIQRTLDGVKHDKDDEGTLSQMELSAEEKASLAARLRMLYLARGKHQDAIRNSPYHSSEENEYWSHQMHGLHLLVADGESPPARRSASALSELRSATDKLATVSDLQIANLTFCTAAHSFGVFETSVDSDQWKNNDYREAKFEPEQPVVLYFEVSNFDSEQHTSREYPDGAWKTSLKGTYTILDHDGRPLEKRELKLRDDICRNRRHDYFVAYKTWMPQINPGHYTLELLIEDTIAGKIGTSTIDFEIVTK